MSILRGPWNVTHELPFDLHDIDSFYTDFFATVPSGTEPHRKPKATCISNRIVRAPKANFQVIRSQIGIYVCIILKKLLKQGEQMQNTLATNIYES
jgi:hypothetical protein